jgi:hypothetical protein
VTLRTRTRMLATLAAWALPLAALAADKPTPAAAPPATDGPALVARAVDAFGGPAAVDAVNALEVKSKGTRRIHADDLQVVIISRFFFPDRYYQELQMPMGIMKTVVGPKEAFIVAGEGALPLPEGERVALLKLMQRSVLAVLKARHQPGFKAVAKGSSSVDGKAVSLVDVTRDGDTVTLAIDSASGQVLRSSYLNPAGGLAPAGEFVVTYSDYRKGPAGPLVYPFNAVATMAGQPAFSQRVEAIIVNPRLDEAMFKQPPPHSMFPGAEDLPLASPSPSLFGSPAPGVLGLPTASPTPSPSPK